MNKLLSGANVHAHVSLVDQCGEVLHVVVAIYDIPSKKFSKGMNLQKREENHTLVWKVKLA